MNITTTEPNYYKLLIKGMTCKGCESKVEKALRAVSGVKDCRVDRHVGEASVWMEDPQVQEVKYCWRL